MNRYEQVYEDVMSKLNNGVKVNISKVIRAKCLNCCCYSYAEVRGCPIKMCPLWYFRFGRNPFYASSTDKRGLRPSTESI